MKIKKIVNKIIHKLGKQGYALDPCLSKRELFSIILEKFVCLLRGQIFKIRLKKADGFLFLGRRCKIRFPHKLSIGKTVIIEDNVEINALSRHGVTIGNNVTIKKNTIIECTGVIRNLGEGLVIGNNVGFAQNCFLQVRGLVNIGSNVIFGPNVCVFSENHGFQMVDIPMMQQEEIRKGVTIENNVWFGSGSIILDGVRIGEGSIVGAGSVVTKDIPPFSIVAGIPAKIIHQRK